MRTTNTVFYSLPPTPRNVVCNTTADTLKLVYHFCSLALFESVFYKQCSLSNGNRILLNLGISISWNDGLAITTTHSRCCVLYLGIKWS